MLMRDRNQPQIERYRILQASSCKIRISFPGSFLADLAPSSLGLPVTRQEKISLSCTRTHEESSITPEKVAEQPQKLSQGLVTGYWLGLKLVGSKAGTDLLALPDRHSFTVHWVRSLTRYRFWQQPPWLMRWGRGAAGRQPWPAGRLSPPAARHRDGGLRRHLQPRLVGVSARLTLLWHTSVTRRYVPNDETSGGEGEVRHSVR